MSRCVKATTLVADVLLYTGCMRVKNYCSVHGGPRKGKEDRHILKFNFDTLTTT